MICARLDQNANFMLGLGMDEMMKAGDSFSLPCGGTALGRR
jgi:hypothetical protein